MSFEGYNGYEVLPDGMPADVARDLAQREMYEQQMEMQRKREELERKRRNLNNR